METRRVPRSRRPTLTGSSRWKRQRLEPLRYTRVRAAAAISRRFAVSLARIDPSGRVGVVLIERLMLEQCPRQPVQPQSIRLQQLPYPFRRIVRDRPHLTVDQLLRRW